jgi:hypothetical protein
MLQDRRSHPNSPPKFLPSSIPPSSSTSIVNPAAAALAALAMIADSIENNTETTLDLKDTIIPSPSRPENHPLMNLADKKLLPCLKQIYLTERGHPTLTRSFQSSHKTTRTTMPPTDRRERPPTASTTPAVA